MTKLLLQEVHALFDYNVIQSELMLKNHMQSVGSHHFAVIELTLPLVSVDLCQHISLWQY